jgi:HNH endonuclease
MEEQTIPQKRCTKCKKEYPATTEYWYRNKRKDDDGLRSQCKECTSKKSKERQNHPEPTDETLMKRCTGPCGKEYPANVKYWHRNIRHKDGLMNKCKECRNKEAETYRSRAEVQEYRKAYGNAYRSHPEMQERNKVYQRAYHSRPEVQERQRAYRSRTDVREHRRAYRSRTEIREHESNYRRVYHSRPEVQERQRAYRRTYHSRPEVQERRRAYQKAYRSRPEARERKITRDRAYYARPEIQERRKAYLSRPDVQEHNKNRHKAYYARPEIQERQRAYLSRPEIQEHRKAWHKAHYSRPEVQVNHRIHSHTRRARNRAVKGTHSPQQIKEQLKRQQHKCYYCKKRLQKAKGKYIYHIEHTFPLSRVAGTDIPANSIDYIVLACPACNMSKHDKFPWEWPEGGRLC